MIAVDTNVVVRLLVSDDPIQSQRAQQLFDDHAPHDGSLWLSDVVVVEVAWTLARAYDRSRSDIAKALNALTHHATVALESPAEIRAALALYAQGPADFADCLLAVKAERHGCEQVVTFDRKMRRLPGVSVLGGTN
ncbi:type II toxin-antitoxin system VapC family toxin [Sphaerotilus sp.]|uniref:PIN domain-containing protein n=1 Tax=Sphaerotilus sp. TaxID=2093942 RepID=UPI002ACD7494|nr:type II toxin-antitoxin system VapC family toxin [Sphaerotilus sp.]MDZ7857062.1 type II toxin-antitoxin system VapC family toxin [Sphaerotilus sp.]